MAENQTESKKATIKESGDRVVGQGVFTPPPKQCGGDCECRHKDGDA